MSQKAKPVSPPVKKLFASIVASFLLFSGGAASAQVSTCADPGGCSVVPQNTQGSVRAHGVCRSVNNQNSNDLVVPHRLLEEFAAGSSAFLENSVPGVQVSRCAPIGVIYLGRDCRDPNTGNTNYTRCDNPSWTQTPLDANFIYGSFTHGTLVTGGAGDNAQDVANYNMDNAFSTCDGDRQYIRLVGAHRRAKAGSTVYGLIYECLYE